MWRFDFDELNYRSIIKINDSVRPCPQIGRICTKESNIVHGNFLNLHVTLCCPLPPQVLMTGPSTASAPSLASLFAASGAALRVVLWRAVEGGWGSGFATHFWHVEMHCRDCIMPKIWLWVKNPGALLFTQNSWEVIVGFTIPIVVNQCQSCYAGNWFQNSKWCKIRMSTDCTCSTARCAARKRRAVSLCPARYVFLPQPGHRGCGSSFIFMASTCLNYLSNWNFFIKSAMDALMCNMINEYN